MIYMTNLAECPYGTVEAGDTKLRICAKYGSCLLFNEFIGQADMGGVSADGKPGGPYWNREDWDSYCRRQIEIVNQNHCSLGQALLAIITEVNKQKENSNPPQFIE